MSKQMMPIMGTCLFVPFDVLDEQQAQANHRQSLAELADRGGLSPREALAVATRKGYRFTPDEGALEELAYLGRRR